MTDKGPFNPYDYGTPERQAFNLGFEDGEEGVVTGLTYDDDPSSPCSVAYDQGRLAGERWCARMPDGRLRG